MIKFLLFLMPILLCCSSTYEFKGEHYIAEFYHCNEKLNDPKALKQVMIWGCENAGATVLDDIVTMFPGGGCSILITLAESHATIHTYPEIKACFLDIFTCGDTCDVWKFSNTLHWMLEPDEYDEQVIERGN